MTVAPGRIRVALALAAVALAGACAFGLWHVVVGGIISGNARAAAFGAALAGTTGVALVALAVAIRRAGRA
ncbi:MAG TPA: hypothetical protein VFI34_03195 [Candidatus Limnocylindrales bacterium]|nr:hypothetical protein [Candidatus Limnocylindrales bacterium]